VEGKKPGKLTMGWEIPEEMATVEARPIAMPPAKAAPAAPEVVPVKAAPVEAAPVEIAYKATARGFASVVEVMPVEAAPVEAAPVQVTPVKSSRMPTAASIVIPNFVIGSMTFDPAMAEDEDLVVTAPRSRFWSRVAAIAAAAMLFAGTAAVTAFAGDRSVAAAHSTPNASPKGSMLAAVMESEPRTETPAPAPRKVEAVEAPAAPVVATQPVAKVAPQPVAQVAPARKVWTQKAPVRRAVTPKKPAQVCNSLDCL
jgi:hypothetical protein